MRNAFVHRTEVAVVRSILTVCMSMFLFYIFYAKDGDRGSVYEFNAASTKDPAHSINSTHIKRRLLPIIQANTLLHYLWSHMHLIILLSYSIVGLMMKL